MIRWCIMLVRVSNAFNFMANWLKIYEKYQFFRSWIIPIWWCWYERHGSIPWKAFVRHIHTQETVLSQKHQFAFWIPNIRTVSTIFREKDKSAGIFDTEKSRLFAQIYWTHCVGSARGACNILVSRILWIQIVMSEIRFKTLFYPFIFNGKLLILIFFRETGQPKTKYSV